MCLFSYYLTNIICYVTKDLVLLPQDNHLNAYRT